VKGAAEGRHITEMTGKPTKGMYFADTENAILFWPCILEFGNIISLFIWLVSSEFQGDVLDVDPVALLLGGMITERIIQLVATTSCLLILTGEMDTSQLNF